MFLKDVDSDKWTMTWAKVNVQQMYAQSYARGPLNWKIDSSILSKLHVYITELAPEFYPSFTHGKTLFE